MQSRGQAKEDTSEGDPQRDVSRSGAQSSRDKTLGLRWAGGAEMLKVGIAGFGFMGRMHFRHWKLVPDVKIVALCDANPNIEEDTKKAVGNIQGAEGEIDLTGLGVFRDLEEMIARPSRTPFP